MLTWNTCTLPTLLTRALVKSSCNGSTKPSLIGRVRVQTRTDIRLTHFNGFSPACVMDCLKCVSKTSSEEALIPGFSCKHIVFKLSNDHNFGCHLLYFELSSSHQGSHHASVKLVITYLSGSL